MYYSDWKKHDSSLSNASVHGVVTRPRQDNMARVVMLSCLGHATIIESSQVHTDFIIMALSYLVVVRRELVTCGN